MAASPSGELSAPSPRHSKQAARQPLPEQLFETSSFESWPLVFYLHLMGDVASALQTKSAAIHRLSARKNYERRHVRRRLVVFRLNQQSFGFRSGNCRWCQ